MSDDDTSSIVTETEQIRPSPNIIRTISTLPFRLEARLRKSVKRACAEPFLKGK